MLIFYVFNVFSLFPVISHFFSSLMSCSSVNAPPTYTCSLLPIGQLTPHLISSGPFSSLSFFSHLFAVKHCDAYPHWFSSMSLCDLIFCLLPQQPFFVHFKNVKSPFSEALVKVCIFWSNSLQIMTVPDCYCLFKILYSFGIFSSLFLKKLYLNTPVKCLVAQTGKSQCMAALITGVDITCWWAHTL